MDSTRGVVATVSATEFKARCLDLLDRVADGRLDRLVVTKRGAAVAAVVRPTGDESATETPPELWGLMRGTVSLPPDLDLTEPAYDGVPDAALGVLHR